MQSTPKIAKPDWLKVKLPGGETFSDLKGILRSRNLHTVCEEARCPNIGECWNVGTATFMLMGDTCTRGCRFCAVKTAKRPEPLDVNEPQKIAAAAIEMKLEYVVLTSVDRDDLADQGAPHFAATIRAIKKADRNILVECLVPDFKADAECIATIVASQPDVFAHNVETVRRLTPQVRDPRATYEQSLSVLRQVKRLNPHLFTKSSIMVGVGENTEEIRQTMQELRDCGVDILTIGQYLQPTPKHMKVSIFVHPETFNLYKEMGEKLGFLYVASGPLVRSSYRAGEFFIKGVLEKQRASQSDDASGRASA